MKPLQWLPLLLGGINSIFISPSLPCVQESSYRRTAGRKTDVFSNNEMEHNQK